jgi:hypothetical protein
LNHFIQRYASWKNVLILLVIMLCFYFVFFPLMLPKGEHAVMLDTQIGYHAGDVYAVIGNYSDAMRQRYILSEITLDLVFPLVYTFMFAFMIQLLYRRGRLALFPFTALIADLLENTGLVTMMVLWPEKLLWLAAATSFFSALKWILVLASSLITAAGIVVYMKKRSNKM